MVKSDSLPHLHSLLRELCRLEGEYEWVEFKCNNSNPEDIGENISALSNSAALVGKPYAYIVWGIEDSPHAVVGTTFRPSAARKGNEQLENRLSHLLSPRIHFRVIEFEYDGKPIVMIQVPKAFHRPVQFKGQEFIRIGSNRHKLKDYPEKQRELWRTFERTPFEDQIAAERVSKSDVLQLLDYPAYFSLLELRVPESPEQIVTRLSDDNLIAQRADGEWDVLNLGAVLFAKKMAEFRHLARKVVRVVLYKGSSRVDTVRKESGHFGYASGYERLIGFLNSLLPANEVIGQALRKTVPVYPEVAVRELVANAIIHQDFSMTGTGPLIEIFPDRLEITNPGEPLMDTNRFLDTPPHSRNESLASFMRRVGVCEEQGTGIDKVVFATEFYQLPAPLFEVASKHTRAVLFASRPFAKLDRNDRIRACYLHACLQRVNHKDMTNASLRARFGIGPKNRAQVSRIIGDTLATGLIRLYDPASGSRKHAKYLPFWA